MVFTNEQIELVVCCSIPGQELVLYHRTLELVPLRRHVKRSRLPSYFFSCYLAATRAHLCLLIVERTNNHFLFSMHNRCCFGFCSTVRYSWKSTHYLMAYTHTPRSSFCSWLSIATANMLSMPIAFCQTLNSLALTPNCLICFQYPLTSSTLHMIKTTKFCTRQICMIIMIT